MHNGARPLEVTFEARVPKLHREAGLHTLRTVSSEGRITYKILAASGDRAVRREVIARYLAAESERRAADETAIEPSQYRFRFLGMAMQRDRRIHRFQVTPKAKRVGLFIGEIWVDAQSGLPVHDSGEFVKSPSILIKRIQFTRDYEVQDGRNLPAHTHATMVSRIVGPVELDTYVSSSSSSVPLDSIP